MNNKGNKQDKYKKICCPKCNNHNYKKDGLRGTENRGKIQRYKCKECSYRFVEDDGFFRMRNSPQKITLCLDLFYKGISTRQVQSHLQAFYPANSSWVSIYKWIVRYSNLIHKKIGNIKLKVGEEIQVDEMEYGHSKRKKDKNNCWFIDCIDVKTRFMVSSEFTKSREQKEIKGVLLNAKKKTDNQVKIVTTDGYTAYEKCVKNVWGYDKKLKKHNVFHNKVTQLKGQGFNHKIERLHNSIRHRTKTFRGFHGSVESANAIMKGYEIYYNFIRKHQAIGKCPYELATDIKLNNPNKWLELIKLSC